MAQVDDVIDALGTLLGKPDWDTLTLVDRLYHVESALQDLLDELEFTRRPVMVKRVELDIQGVEGVTLPDDFGSVYHLVTDSSIYLGEAAQQLTEVYPTDVEFSGPEFTDNRCAGFSVTDDGTGPRLVGFPDEALSTSVVLWYRPLGVDLDLDTEIPLSRRFHLNVLPLMAAFYCVPYCTWASMGGDGSVAYRGELGGKLEGRAAAAFAKYKQLIQKPEGNGGPDTRISGFGAARNAYRFGLR